MPVSPNSALVAFCLLSPTVTALGQGSLIHSVADLPATASFYRALGLPAKSPLPAPGAIPAIFSGLEGTKGARFRSLTFEIPGEAFALELIEFTKVERGSALARIQDAGAPRLVLSVRDVAVASATAQRAGGKVLTPGGAIVVFGTAATGIAVRDPDGLILELVQFNPLPKTTAPSGSNIIGGRLSISVGDLDKTVPFYRDALGFEVKPANAFGPSPNVMQLFDAQGGQWRYAMANLPGESTNWELAEFKDLPKKRFAPRISDPGAGAFSLFVRDLPAVVQKVKSGGGVVVSADANTILVRDPDGVLLRLIEKK